MTRNEARKIVHEIAPGVMGAYEQMLIRAVLAGAEEGKKPEEENGSWAELRERFSSTA